MVFATRANILTSGYSTAPYDTASMFQNARLLLNRIRRYGQTRSFGGQLEPRCIFGAESLDQ